MFQYIEIYDYLLLIIYTGIIFIFLRKYANKHTPPPLRRYFYGAFFLRILGCILYSLVTVYYYGYGDSLTFFRGGNMFTEQIAKSPSNIQYLFASLPRLTEWYSTLGSDDYIGDYFIKTSGNLVMKLSALLSYISFNRFLIISLFFALFSFAGQWKLFLVFDSINKQRNRKILAWAILYSPSIWFWGSGLMKDSVCLGALGFLVSVLYKWKTQKKISLKNMIMLAIMVYLIAVLKFYILAILLVSAITLFITLYFKSITNILKKIALIFLMATGLVITFTVLDLDIGGSITEFVQDAVSQINNFKNTYEVSQEQSDGSGGFTAVDINPTFNSLLLKVPGVVFSCLYRPFLWESRKVMILFTSLESTLLLFFTLYLMIRTKFIGFFKAIFKNEYLFFCLTLSLLFSIVIGFTTFNFGTMIRYKIIFLPFFYFLLVHIYTMHVQKKQG